MKQQLFLGLGVAVLGLAVSGCGGSGLHEVSGTVQFNGTPVKEGRILFRNLGGDKRAYSAGIANGNYAVELPEGKLRVEITASRIIPGKFDTANGVKEPVGEMYIPVRYNAKSQLTVVVDGANRSHSFDLKK